MKDEQNDIKCKSANFMKDPLPAVAASAGSVGIASLHPSPSLCPDAGWQSPYTMAALPARLLP